MRQEVTISDDGWIFDLMLNRPNWEGKNGRDYLIEHGIIPVKRPEVPMVHLSKEGFYGVNQQVPLNRTIFIRIESPFIMADVHAPGVANGYMAVLTYGHYGESYGFNEPQDYGWFHKYFDSPREELLCLLSRDRASGGPKFKGIEQRSLRRELVSFFDDKLGDRFHSYGRGWTNKGYKGYAKPYNAKFEIISRYKFNIAVEGERYNGRITEKIFQAMACGSIPIYQGPRDIDKYIPNDCYLDLREYDLEDLYEKIINMSEEEREEYRGRIKDFLMSERADVFSSVQMAKVIEKIIREKFVM